MTEAVDFLGTLFTAGQKYSSNFAARAALSGYLEIKYRDKFREHRLVKRFIKEFS